MEKDARRELLFKTFWQGVDAMIIVEFIDNSQKFIDDKNKAIATALESIGLTVERYAKERCPVDTGLLRNSLTHAVSGNPPAIKSYHADYGKNRQKSGNDSGSR